MKTRVITILLLNLLALTINGQPIELLLKNGHVIDPANNINAKMDVAISGGKVVKVAQTIAAADAKQVIDVNGFYVCPD